MSNAAFRKEREALEAMSATLAESKVRAIRVNATDVAARTVAILCAWDKEGDPQQWDEFRIKLAADVAVQIEKASAEAAEKATNK